MHDDVIAAIAKATAPFVRDCVDQAICKMAIVPPELAAQIASAVRSLHEAPPVVERSELPPQQPALPRLTRIERDENGNFVPVYGEPQT
jgi:hypothetical protein